MDANEMWVKFQYKESDIDNFIRRRAEISDLSLPISRRTEKGVVVAGSADG